MRFNRIHAALAALIVLVDQITKYFADKLISPAGPVDLIPILRLVNVKNKGAAFGSLQNAGNAFFIPVALIAIAVIAYLIIKEKRFVYWLLLAGAVGNLIDRLMLGHVRDFVDVYWGRYHWPAFNVADSALTMGMVLLIWMSVADLYKSRNPKAVK